MPQQIARSPADIRIAGNESGFQVVPPVFVATPGGTYEIRNQTRFVVIVTFPPEIVEGGRQLQLQPAGNAGDQQPFTTNPNGSGLQEYTVDVRVADDASLRAIGSSNPRILFD
jgi:hypothetical protein